MNNRKIQFRGKRTGNGEWVYGGISQYRNRTYVVVNGVNFRVDADTVDQFTGLQDRDGKDIYEGDILECFELHVEYEDYDVYPPYSSKIEQYEVRRNISAVTFDYGSFCAFDWPIDFGSFWGNGSHDEKLREEFDALWEDNCGEIRDKYPNLTWEDFGKIRVIGNIHDNPGLLKVE